MGRRRVKGVVCYKWNGRLVCKRFWMEWRLHILYEGRVVYDLYFYFLDGMEGTYILFSMYGVWHCE